MEGFTNHLVACTIVLIAKKCNPQITKNNLQKCELTYFTAMLHNHIVKNNP